MSDADRLRVSYIEEVTYGVTPSGSLKDLRLTSESLRQDTDMVTSAEIRNDRQVPVVKRANIRASGGINFELSADAYDDLFEFALLASAWTSNEVVGPLTTISAAAADNSFNDSASGFGGLDVGRWVKVSGFVNAANNGYFKILTVAAGKITVSGGTLVTEAVGPSVTVNQGGHVEASTTMSSISIEKHYTDLTNVYALFPGLVPDRFSLSVTPEQIVTGSFEFLGQKEVSATASAGSGYTAAPTADVLNAVDDVKAILEAQTTFQATQFSLQLANNLRQRIVIGTLGAISIGAGSIELTGTLQAYFQSAAIMNKYLNSDKSSLAVAFQDGATPANAYVIDIPRIRYSSGQRVGGGRNTDIRADLAWSAFMHETELKTFKIFRW